MTRTGRDMACSPRSDERAEVEAGACGVCADRAVSGWSRRSRSRSREGGVCGPGRLGRERAPEGRVRMGLCGGGRRF